MSKKVNIHVSRRITVSRPGREPVVLEPGRNTVDEDVARHPYVKHFLTDEPAVVDNAEADALRARVAHLTEEVEDRGMAIGQYAKQIKEQGEHIQAVNAQLNERAKENDDLQQRHDKHAARVTELEEQLAQKTADIDALVASMSAPAETGTKGKGK